MVSCTGAGWYALQRKEVEYFGMGICNEQCENIDDQIQIPTIGPSGTQDYLILCVGIRLSRTS